MAQDNLKLENVYFLKSSSALSNCPTPLGIEVAFVGRSNAGKSSCLNALANKKIAKTSKTPGRTLLINYFVLNDKYRLVDLPGYGYAKIDHKTQADVEQMLSSYLTKRKDLKALVVIMDARRPLTEVDQELISLASERQIDLHLVLTKADKLNRSDSNKVLNKVKEEMPTAKSIQLFSSLKNTGVQELRETVLKYFN